jgi:hypothetical protein
MKRMLHHMLQFTNIAWPVVANELVHFMLRNIRQSAVLSLGKPGEETDLPVSECLHAAPAALEFVEEIR